MSGIDNGYPDNTFLLVFIGMLTGVGGGLMRDMMAGEEPYIFVKHIYACASLVGGICCVWLYRSIGRLPAVFIAAFVVMAIRFLAAHFRWNLPHPKTLS
ncbi:MAG: trimeric intracellular cation channel family protein [Waltera sp.]